MLTTVEIKQKIAGKPIGEQLRLIGEMMTDAMDAADSSLLLAEKGKVLWRAGRRGEAMTAYEEGAQLCPGGPASVLLEHSRDIMDFFNPDLLNP